MKISLLEALSAAFERMRQVLFRPFDLVKWLVLGFSAWLAGLASGGGGGGTGSIDPDDFDSPRELLSGVEQVWQRLLEHAFLIPLILVGLILLLAIVLLLIWISSRAKFIFLDNVVHDRAAIVAPWRQFRRIGNSLFLWRLGFTVACALAAVLLLIVVLAPAATLSLTDAVRGLSFAGIFFGALGMVALGVVAGFIALLVENFVIPIMYRFDLDAIAAWRAFLPWLRRHLGWFVLYGLFLLAIAIPALAAYLVLCCCTCCIVAVPYVGTVILLPVWVTYRLLGPAFLAQLDPSFELVAAAPQPAEVADPAGAADVT